MTAEARAARRVLVVDDSRDAADCLAMLLELEGHAVATAYDGQEAVELAGIFTPDAVVLDINLPKLSGHQVARRIRDQLGVAVLLIALTGWDSNADSDRTTATDFDHHLTKPVELDALVKLLALDVRRTP